MRSICAIYPVITENTECSIIKVFPFIVFKVGVRLIMVYHLCFVSLLALQTFWASFRAKNDARSAPANTAPTPVSHRSHNVRTVTNAALERGMENKGEQR